MLSLPKVLGVVFCGLLFTMGLSTIAQTEVFDDRMPGGQGADETQLHQIQRGQSPVGKTIQGEVLRVEGNDCVSRVRMAKRCGYKSTYPS